MAADAALRTEASRTEATGAHVPKANWGWFLFRGLLAVALGVVSFLFPLNALFAFTMVFAAFAFVEGVASLGSGIKGARPAGTMVGARPARPRRHRRRRDLRSHARPQHDQLCGHDSRDAGGMVDRRRRA